MSDSECPQFWKELVSHRDALRAYALRLLKNSDKADDLVQETLCKAFEKSHLFVRDTNLRAWLFTIMRNTNYLAIRKNCREVQDYDGKESAKRWVYPEQDAYMRALEAQKKFNTLPLNQRKALILVAMLGYEHREAAQKLNCPEGTVKSRVNRARRRLQFELKLIV